MGQTTCVGSCVCSPWAKPSVQGCKIVRAAQVAPAHLSWSSRRNILCFGDSLTEGLCWPSGDGQDCRSQEFCPYSARLMQRLEALCNLAGGTLPNVVNAGVSGETTDEMLPRLPSLLYGALGGALYGEQDVVLILGGTNDMAFASAEDIVHNILKLHRKAHKLGCVTVVMTVPQIRRHFSSKMRAVNLALSEFAQENWEHSVLVDVAALFPQDLVHASLWEGDGVHFSREGYVALGDILADSDLPGDVLADAEVPDPDGG